MNTCPQCGQENRDDARFCIKCGSPLGAPAQPAQQEGAPPAGAGAAPPPPQVAPIVTQPTAPAAYPPPTPPGAYVQAPPSIYTQPTPAAPPSAAYPAAPPTYAAPAKTRGSLFWIGAVIIVVAGALVLVSTFMAWGSGPMGVMSLSGWDWFDIGRAGRGAPGEVVNAFFIYSDGYPIFTGLCSLILGGLIALIGLLMLAFRSKGLGGIALLFSLFALGMATTNLTTILRTEGISVGVGMYLFLIFSFLGLVGGGMALSG